MCRRSASLCRDIIITHNRQEPASRAAEERFSFPMRMEIPITAQVNMRLSWRNSFDWIHWPWSCSRPGSPAVCSNSWGLLHLMTSPQGQRHRLAQIQTIVPDLKNNNEQQKTATHGILEANIHLYERKQNSPRDALYGIVKLISGRNVAPCNPHKTKHASFSLECRLHSFCGWHCSAVNVGQK